MVTFLLYWAAYFTMIIMGVATLFSTGAVAVFMEKLFRRKRSCAAVGLLVVGLGLVFAWMVAADLLMVWANPIIETFDRNTEVPDPSRGAAPGTWYRPEFPVWNILGWALLGMALVVLFASKFFGVGFLALALGKPQGLLIGGIAFYSVYLLREWLPGLDVLPHYRGSVFWVIVFHLLSWAGVFLMLSSLESARDLEKFVEDAGKK